MYFFFVGCKYPLEAPIVAFIALSERVPVYMCMRITQKLQELANECASKEQPCVFELIALLDDRPHEIEVLCRESPKVYYEPSIHLFPKKQEMPVEEDAEELSESMPSLVIESSSKRVGRNHQKIMRSV